MSDKAFAIAMASTIPKGPKGDKGDPGDVSSVNSKTGAVVLDAGDLEYDASDTYTGGTVGAAVSDLKSQIEDVDDAVFVSVNAWEPATIGENDKGTGYYYTDGAYHSSNSYCWVAYKCEAETDIYATTSTTTGILCVYNSSTFSAANLVISKSKQAGDFPTQADPLTVQANNWVVLTEKSASQFKQVIYLNTIETTVKKMYTGKKWSCVGDSWTAVNSYATERYFDFVKSDLGIEPANYGVSGTGYTNDGGLTNKEFYNRVDNLGTPDVVTIFGSGNDCEIEDLVIGEVTDTTAATVCGAINLTITNYLTTYPNTPLGIIAPAPWIHGSYFPSNPDSVMTSYVEAMQNVCEFRGIPFLDLYHCSDLRPEIEDNRSSSEKVYYNTKHINNLGQRIIYPKIREFLKTLL